MSRTHAIPIGRFRRLAGRLLITAALALVPLAALAAPIEAETYQIGVAAIDITPEHAIRLNGFGFRREESDGVRQRIWAKALAIGSDEQGPAVLITVDILGIPDELAGRLAERLAARTAIRRERLALTATHTHSAPLLRGENETIFGVPIPEDHLQHIDQYTRVFEAKLEQVAFDALADRSPATLHWGLGTVGFAKNRRRAGGPVDHDLPLLAVRSPEGKLRALYFSYACHCVTLSDNRISGDWAGYAQEAIQRDYPGAVALCSVGCGADSNPSSGVTGDRADVAAGQGEEIASEVRRLLGGFLAPVAGKVTAQFERVELPLQPLPTRAEWEELAKLDNPTGHHARAQLAKLDRGERLIEKIEAPIQTWRFGDSLAMLYLPGETVVDYALRLKRELDASRLWVNGYSNAAPGYLPSERILMEGGYEGGGAMIYYDIPRPYAAGLEQEIIDVVHRQVGEGFKAKVQAAGTHGVVPLSPQQSAAQLRTRPEMQAQLVAAEPLIVDPVAIDFGPDGRLWVAEMHDYPLGLDGDYQPGGRVSVLRDLDGDGVYDVSSVFLDGIPFPTGVTVWRSGVLVCAAPDMLYAEDVDGDGRADVRRVLFSGFGTGNYQARVNSLQYGLDGWVYGSCGLFGGGITSFASGELFPLGDRDFRIQPDNGKIEPATGRTQQGRVRDDWDNWFGCTSGSPVIHYPLADHDLRRNPFLAGAPAQVGLTPSNKLYPVVPPLTFKLSGPPGFVTAACGLGIYRDCLLGPDFTGNTFTCEPVSQIVHRLQLMPAGASFTARRAADETEHEFLASADRWFRPVQARTGPDGALWIVDMYRYIIEHPRWIPPEDIADVDLRAGQSKGRIYRIFPRENPPRAIARLDLLDTAGLVAALDSPNGPQRDLAGQMLLWRDDRSAAARLTSLAEHGSRPEARLHALTTLDGLNSLTEETLLRSLRDEHAGVRRHAVRIAGKRLQDSTALLAAVLELLDDSDPFVRVQLAVGLGESTDPRAAAGLVQLAGEHPGDRYLQAAVASSIGAENVEALLASVLEAKGDAPRAPGLLGPLLSVAVASRIEEALAVAVDTMTLSGPNGPAEWQTRALTELLAAIFRRDVTLVEALGADGAQEIRRVLTDLRHIAADGNTVENQRLAAIAVLGRVREEQAEDLGLLGGLVHPQQPVAVQLAAVEALGRVNRLQGLVRLLDGWQSCTPQVRMAIFDAATARAAWLSKALDALERGAIAATELDAARVQRLVEHPDESVRTRAGRIFGRFAQGDRQAVLQQYQRAAELEGDSALGEKLFTKTCSVCHRLRGVGHAVGPDLAPLVNKTPEYLLLAMLDPSRAVDSRYLSYGVVTKDGRTFTGMLAEESGGSITLVMQEGKQQTILRGDIDELRSTGKSLMPEGVEKDLSVQDMADIIAFLRAAPAVATGGTAAELSKPFAGNEPRLVEPDESGRLLLLATNGRIYGGDIGFEEPFRNIGFWHGDQDHVEWTVKTTSDRTYDVWLVYACDDGSAGNRFVLTGGSEPLRGEVAGTGGWDRYRRQQIGSLRLSAGEHRFSMWPDGPLTRPALLDLHGLEFVPVGTEPQLPPPTAANAVAVAGDPRQIATQILNEAVPAAQREALVAAHPDLAADLIAAMSADLPAGAEEYRRIPWIWRVAIAAGKRNDEGQVRAILALSLPGPERPLRDWQAVVIGGGIINGISQQNVWPRERIAEVFKDHDELVARWDRLLDLASRMADDERVPTGTRYDALRIIGCGEWESHGAQLQKYLPQGTTDELQMGAVSGLVDIPSPRATEALVGALKYLKGTNRELALDGLLRDVERAGALLDAVMRGEVNKDDLGARRIKELREHGDTAIRARAEQLLAIDRACDRH